MSPRPTPRATGSFVRARPTPPRPTPRRKRIKRKRNYTFFPLPPSLSFRSRPGVQSAGAASLGATRHQAEAEGNTKQQGLFFINFAGGAPLRPRGPQSLADRECLSLDPRRRFQRRPESRPPRRRARELATLRRWALSLLRRGQHPENRAQGPAPHRGMGPRVPPISSGSPSPRPTLFHNAFALPSRVLINIPAGQVYRNPSYSTTGIQS